MHSMREDLLQFIWRNKLLKPVELKTVSGKTIRIVRFGEQNLNAGPDFFNAAVQIDGLLLVGNVELHVRTSDWLKHGHEQDRSYDKLVLHVVYEHDAEVKQNQDHGVEVLELHPYIAAGVTDNYAALQKEAVSIACSKSLAKADDLVFVSWVERMAVERLEEKVLRINNLFQASKGDYTQTFYVLLLTSFGFKVNAQPFEMLAKQLPLSVLLRHAHNLKELEALLLGMAGLLEAQFATTAVQDLQNEFEFLRAKYNLVPLPGHLFKYSRLRPANFPHLRLAQLAAILHHQPEAVTNPLRALDLTQLKQQFCCEPQGYWSQHYTADGKKASGPIKLGTTSVESIAINAYAPFLFFYAAKTGREELKERAIGLLEACAFENNAKTRHYVAKQQLFASALTSQGLIHLHNQYCLHKRCLGCAVCASLLKQQA